MSPASTTPSEAIQERQDGERDGGGVCADVRACVCFCIAFPPYDSACVCACVCYCIAFPPYDSACVCLHIFQCFSSVLVDYSLCFCPPLAFSPSLSFSHTCAYSPTGLVLSLQAPVRVAGKGGESHCGANTCDAGAVATRGGSGTSPERLAGKEGIPTCASNAGSADSPGRERGGSRTCGGAKGGRRDREGAARGGAACKCGGGENTAPSTGSGDSGGESAPGCGCRGDSEAASGTEACEKWVLCDAVRVDESDGTQPRLGGGCPMGRK